MDRHLFPAVFAGLLFQVALPAAANEQLSVVLNGRATHVEDTRREQNETNLGLGLQYDLGANGWIPYLSAAGFEDSRNDMSYYAGGGYRRRFELPVFDNYHVDVGGIAFLMTRKSYADGTPFPGVLPVISFGGPGASLNLTYIPKVHDKIVPLWFVQLAVPITGMDN